MDETNLVQWLITVSALLLLLWHQRLQPWPPLRVCGAALCMLGFATVSLARYQLGRSFSVRARARQLVTTGLYTRVRNPMYVAGEVFLLGVALVLHSWLPVLLLVAAIPVQIVPARREAAVLEAAFGEQYRTYRAHTWF